MKRKKAKTVKAWAFAVRCPENTHFIQSINDSKTKRDIFVLKLMWSERGYQCGPIVRIEVPAPRSESMGSVRAIKTLESLRAALIKAVKP